MASLPTSILDLLTCYMVATPATAISEPCSGANPSNQSAQGTRGKNGFSISHCSHNCKVPMLIIYIGSESLIIKNIGPRQHAR